MKQAAREVKETQQESVQHESPTMLPLLHDALNVYEADAASNCSNGICGLPAPQDE